MNIYTPCDCEFSDDGSLLALCAECQHDSDLWWEEYARRSRELGNSGPWAEDYERAGW